MSAILMILFKHKLSLIIVLRWLYNSLSGPVLWQLLVTKTNSNTSNKSLNRISSGDHKRTRQEISTRLLSYIYYYMWFMLWLHFYCTSYPKVHVSSMSAPFVHHEVTMWLTCFLISSSRLFPTSLNSSRLL